MARIKDFIRNNPMTSIVFGVVAAFGIYALANWVINKRKGTTHTSSDSSDTARFLTSSNPDPNPIVSKSVSRVGNDPIAPDNDGMNDISVSESVRAETNMQPASENVVATSIIAHELPNFGIPTSIEAANNLAAEICEARRKYNTAFGAIGVIIADPSMNNVEYIKSQARILYPNVIYRDDQYTYDNLRTLSLGYQNYDSYLTRILNSGGYALDEVNCIAVPAVVNMVENRRRFPRHNGHGDHDGGGHD